MIDRPALARALTAYEAPDDSVILTGATDDFLLTGSVYRQLIPVLNGERQADDIAEALSASFDPAEVYYGLRCLEAEGCLAEGPADAAYAGTLHSGGVQIMFGDDPLFLSAPASSPWQFVSPAKHGYWIGPRFGLTEDSPCPDCLNFRLLGNRPFAAFARKNELKVIASPRRRAQPESWLLERAAEHALPDALIVTDSDGNEISRHAVSRRPECVRCGDPADYSQRAGEPVRFKHAPVSDTRCFADSHAALLDPVTGITRGVRKLDGAISVHVYVGGSNRAHAPKRLAQATRHLRSFASGKGQDDLAARASLIGEVAERYSAVFRGDEPHSRAAFSALGKRAIHPNEVMLFSDRQLEQRAGMTTDNDPIPHALPEHEEVEWTPAWSLTEKCSKLLPTSLLYLDTPAEFGSSFCIADSNGNAAGATLESAMLQGLLELIERDAVGIWWFNEIPRPGLELGSLNNAWVSDIVANLVALGRDVNVLDVTTDIAVPCYAAVSRKLNSESEQILFGFGAHVDAEFAAVRAITELGQTLAILNELHATGAPLTPSLDTWLKTQSVETCGFLRPSGQTGLHPSITDSLSAASLIEICRARLEQRGLECLVLDHTRADVGIPVVKMIVPGLRHYRQRLAPGRLYSTPVNLGWMDTEKTEESLNPQALPF